MLQYTVENGLVVHWDGKLLPDITGHDKVDRLPILVTQEETEQLIGVPKLKSGTGEEIASNVFNQLNIWQLIEKIQAVCFDTTAANTGSENGAAVLLERKIGRDLLYLPCRHHIFEIVLREVFLRMVFNSTTVGPNIPLFERLKKEWNNLDQTFFNIGTTDDIVKRHINPRMAEEIKHFCFDQLAKNICRDDYKELLELVVLFLGFNLPNGNRFRKPGASHHARWMAKAIYALKLFMFRDQFNISKIELNGIRDVCIFLILIYIKAWFRSNLSIEAPNNDIQFIQASIAYSQTDPTISDIIIEKFSNHLWYLASESIGLSFFDENVSNEEKTKMITALNTQRNHCKRFKITPSEIKNSFSSIELNNFVSSETMKFFDRFEICTDFLQTDPSTWSLNENYIIGRDKCRNIKVVNDCAERCVQLFTNYNQILTKDESQKQYLLQVVKDYITQFPSSYKKNLL